MAVGQRIDLREVRLAGKGDDMIGFLNKGKEDKDESDEKKELRDTERAVGVVKVIEVVATSSTSFDDAIARGIKTAASSLRNISGADVKHMTVAVKDGKVSEYRVDLKIAFALDEDDD